jgi:hypothetical protein
MKDESEQMKKELVVAYFKVAYYPGIGMEGLNATI